MNELQKTPQIALYDEIYEESLKELQEILGKILKRIAGEIHLEVSVMGFPIRNPKEISE